MRDSDSVIVPWCQLSHDKPLLPTLCSHWYILGCLLTHAQPGSAIAPHRPEAIFGNQQGRKQI